MKGWRAFEAIGDVDEALIEESFSFFTPAEGRARRTRRAIAHFINSRWVTVAACLLVSVLIVSGGVWIGQKNGGSSHGAPHGNVPLGSTAKDGDSPVSAPQTTEDTDQLLEPSEPESEGVYVGATKATMAPKRFMQWAEWSEPMETSHPNDEASWVTYSADFVGFTGSKEQIESLDRLVTDAALNVRLEAGYKLRGISVYDANMQEQVYGGVEDVIGAKLPAGVYCVSLHVVETVENGSNGSQYVFIMENRAVLASIEIDDAVAG